MNHYDVLDLPKNATGQEIKRAYRRLVKKFHPDSQSQQASHEQIILINAAYEVLSDPRRRRYYDQSQANGSAFPQRESRNRQASQACYQGQQRSRQADLNREQWLRQVYHPIAKELTVVIESLDGQIDYLAADLFDDELMATFQSYLGEVAECLGRGRQRLKSAPNPQSFAKVAAFLYYALNHVEDALEELTTFTQNYDESFLHTGQELFRLTRDLLMEADITVQRCAT
ncbi:MAG: J domain-containing protein [Synechocystis sp.]|nr:J domain-containing protein [Synechocystis sp.]